MSTQIIATHYLDKQTVSSSALRTCKDKAQDTRNQNTNFKYVRKKIHFFFLITQLCLLQSKNKNKTPFHPYQTPPHPDHLGSIVRGFILGRKEHDDTDDHFPLMTQRTEDTLCPPEDQSEYKHSPSFKISKQKGK